MSDVEAMDSLFHQSMTWVMENDITGALDLSFTVSEEIFGEVTFFYSRDTYYGWTQSSSSWWTRVLFSNRHRLPVQMLSEFENKAVFVCLEHKETTCSIQILKGVWAVGIACEQALHLGKSWEVTRGQYACEGRGENGKALLSHAPRSLARSHVLSCLASLVVNGQLASRLMLEVKYEMPAKAWLLEA